MLSSTHSAVHLKLEKKVYELVLQNHFGIHFTRIGYSDKLQLISIAYACAFKKRNKGYLSIRFTRSANWYARSSPYQY